MIHKRVRPFNTKDTYPEQRLDNDLCQAVVTGKTIYLRGQVPQDLDTRENVNATAPIVCQKRPLDDHCHPLTHRLRSSRHSVCLESHTGNRLDGAAVLA